MTVYVDDMYRYRIGQYGRMRMSHMVADTRDELLKMADRIGVNRKWIQNAGTPREHFDVSKSKRELAVRAGAEEVDIRQMAAIIRTRKART